MNLLRKKGKVKSSKTESRKKERLLKLAATTQNTIKYTSQFENGLMHIVDDEYSKMVELGDLDYEIASDDEQYKIVISYAEALNSIDKNSRYQLLVLNKAIHSSVLENILLPYQADEYDSYRGEINQIISERYKRDQMNFEIKKYAIFSTKTTDSRQANRQLSNLIQNFEKRYNESDTGLDIRMMGGYERLEIMAGLLRPEKHFRLSYDELALTGLTTKSFIAPNRLTFREDYFQIDDHFGKVMYIREYPKNLEDQLIHELCKCNREIAISIHAKPYDMSKVRKDIQNKQLMNKASIIRQQKDNFKEGISEGYISGLSVEVEATTDNLMEAMKENGEKLFSGIFAVLVVEETLDKLRVAEQEIKDIAHTWLVDFDDVYKMQEEALNTILPIGKPYLDVEKNYMRDMTTVNVATQIPYTNIELQSPTGLYYGQNQMSHNLITIDRKADLITPSGLILGSSGSGKSVTVKWGMILNLLKNPHDRLIIVDPESEYLPIAKTFNAQILEISSGTQNHLNILDMVDRKLLDQEDLKVDLVKEKANLLASLFESVLKEFSDTEASIVDRVTRLTYQRFESIERMPTLVDWHQVLKEQPEVAAKELAIKVEPYAIGSQDIFAHETNIDLTDRFILFNIKHLDERLKPFAMKVILDQIWKQVVAYQNSGIIHLFFDEIQLNFDTVINAIWFMNLWSRIRKYGAVTTGITQNVSTLLETSAGQKMISNSELIILLRQKVVDLQHLKNVMKIKPNLLKYVNDHVPQGTGLISAGGVVVPFENPIPKNTKLFELLSTDA
jgi:hypothetical protein